MFKLPELPYARNALEPYISEETLDYHYWKHHQAYVTNLNSLTNWSWLDDSNLISVIKDSRGPLFNNAAQVYNHTFYWNCMWPNKWGKPKWKIAELIDRDFWSFEEFKDLFSKSAASNFGSWWTWLAKNREWKLEIINTSNAETVITTNKIPLLVIDIWEHAYYIDTRNVRPKYIENFWNLINWDFVNKNLK
jgi:superoxide dismutase, Fe-Mn family